MLGFPYPVFERCLISRELGTRSLVRVRYKPQEACASRDALAKALYGSLFAWIVAQINMSLTPIDDQRSVLSIGVLDIFGFEFFEHNSFEQLCINYCNEKLQFHFNNHVFLLEQSQYMTEGVDVSAISFKDNAACVDLLEMPRNGIFSLCDEQLRVPGGGDVGFLATVLNKHGNHEYLSAVPRDVPNRGNCFAVSHFAGTVAYDCTGFLEKNKDTLSEELSSLFQNSSDTFIRDLFSVKITASSGRQRTSL